MSSWRRRCTKDLVKEFTEYPFDQLLDAEHQPLKIQDSHFFDVVVIGAGPAALSLVTRMLEDRPAAIYLEDERRHLHWLNRTSHCAPTLKTRGGGSVQYRTVLEHSDKLKSSPRHPKARILILDKHSSGWMTQWRSNFASLEIPYLRSPMFFHPDPSDLDGLLEYAMQTGRINSAPHTVLCDILTGRSGPRVSKASAKVPDRPDLLQVPGVVGSEFSKHKRKQMQRRGQDRNLTSLGPIVNERDRRDYQNPSTTLFNEFTDELVSRYHLEPPRDKHGHVCPLSHCLCGENLEDLPARLLRANVTDLDYGRLQICRVDREDEDVEAFKVNTEDGCCIAARCVVSAVGYGGIPKLPAWLSSTIATRRHSVSLSESRDAATNEDTDGASSTERLVSADTPGACSCENKPERSVPWDGRGWAHSMAICSPGYIFPPPTVQARIRCQDTTVVIIGGGLSSAQICDLCVRRGFTRVILLMRGFFKVKPFDFGIDWLGKYANVNKMRFWQLEEGRERMKMINEGRNGGSINPPYARILLQHARDNKVEIKTHTEVEDAKWVADTQRWHLRLRRHDHAKPESQFMNNKQQPGTVMSCTADFIVSATGSQVSFSALPFMRTLSQKMHVPEVDGIPFLDENLRYGPLPLFCVGTYSALQIGPTAYNLGGIREGADRVATKLREMEKAGTRTPLPEGSLYTHFSYQHLPVDASL